MYLVNPGDDHATITKGSILTGFGKISFRQPSDNNAETLDASQDIPFSPEGSETCVLVDSTVFTIGELVNKRSEEKTSDQANICYHNMEMLPQGCFKLIQKTLVCARVKEQKLQGPCVGEIWAHLAIPRSLPQRVIGMHSCGNATGATTASCLSALSLSSQRMLACHSNRCSLTSEWCTK